MNLETLIAYLKTLGFHPKINKFEDRLIIQKTAYLLQLKKMPLNYNFGLYARGPYSPTLTKEIYEHQKEIEQLQTKTQPNQTEKEKLTEFHEIFPNPQPSILEIAATYAHFAYKEKQDPLTAKKNTKTMKQFYTETQLTIGINKAKQFLYQPTPQEQKEILNEFQPWQNATTKRG